MSVSQSSPHSTHNLPSAYSGGKALPIKSKPEKSKEFPSVYANGGPSNIIVKPNQVATASKASRPNKKRAETYDNNAYQNISTEINHDLSPTMPNP